MKHNGIVQRATSEIPPYCIPTTHRGQCHARLHPALEVLPVDRASARNCVSHCAWFDRIADNPDDMCFEALVTAITKGLVWVQTVSGFTVAHTVACHIWPRSTTSKWNGAS